MHVVDQANFFKDRHWTDREFEDLGALVTGETEAVPTAGPSKIVLEVGCGVGNLLYPLALTCFLFGMPLI